MLKKSRGTLELFHCTVGKRASRKKCSGCPSSQLQCHAFIKRCCCSGFTQWDINQGALRYVQNKNESFDAREPVDSFTFDVSNGFTSLRNITCRIEIIPHSIPLRYCIAGLAHSIKYFEQLGWMAVFAEV